MKTWHEVLYLLVSLFRLGFTSFSMRGWLSPLLNLVAWLESVFAQFWAETEDERMLSTHSGICLFSVERRNQHKSNKRDFPSTSSTNPTLLYIIIAHFSITVWGHYPLRCHHGYHHHIHDHHHHHHHHQPCENTRNNIPDHHHHHHHDHHHHGHRGGDYVHQCGEKGWKRIFWSTVEHDAETNEGMQEGKLLDKYFQNEQ